MEKKLLIAANWKMNKTQAEARAFATELTSFSHPADRQILIAASYTLLPTLYSVLRGTTVFLGAQDMYFEEEGSFTGEVSPAQVKDAGASHVIIGHSERRQLFGDTNQVVKRKVQAAEKSGIIPIICVGETKQQREEGNAKNVVKEQVQAALDGCTETFCASAIIAYEPVWAIGSGETPAAEDIEEMHAMILNNFPNVSRVIYGGSVSHSNAAELMRLPSVGGFLVGGASLDFANFSKIVNIPL